MKTTEEQRETWLQETSHYACHKPAVWIRRIIDILHDHATLAARLAEVERENAEIECRARMAHCCERRINGPPTTKTI